MDPYAKKAQLEQQYAQQTTPENISAKSQSIRNAVFSNVPEIDSARSGINSKIAELYSYDKDVGSRYSDPNSSMHVDNPMVAWNAEADRKGQISGQIGDLFGKLGKYQDLYGNVVEQGLKVWEKSLNALEKQIGLAQEDIGNNLDLKKLAAASANKGTSLNNKNLDEEQQIFESLINKSASGKDFETSLNALIPQLKLRGLNTQHIWDMYDALMQSASGLGKGVAARQNVDIRRQSKTIPRTSGGYSTEAGASASTSNSVQDWVDEQVQAGNSGDEIAKALRDAGQDPSQYRF